MMRFYLLCWRRAFLTALVLVCLVSITFAQSDSEPLRVRRNFLGMHNLKGGGVTPFQTGMDWTKTLVGDGFIMDWVTDYAPDAPDHWLQEAMLRNLVPTIRVQQCQPKDNSDCGPSVGYSANVARQIFDWKVQNPAYADRYVYMQLWNEPGDARDFVPMDEFADFLVAAYGAVHAVENEYVKAHPDLDLKGTLLVMTPGQNDGWDTAFNHNPQAKFSFDVWATHPYPDMTPPWYNIHDGDLPSTWLKTIDSYIQDLDETARSHNGVPGRRGFPVMITETNYGHFVGHSTIGWPKLTQEARAPFTVDAYFRRWYEWPEIVAVHPFLLNNNAWPAFEFVHSWSSQDLREPFGVLEPASPLPVYVELEQARREAEAAGRLAPARLSPYRGPVGHIAGQVTRSGTGEVVPYATLYTDGYEFGHLTLFDGRYEIHDVPTGSYTLSVQKGSYLPASREIVVREGQTTIADFSVTLTGKVLETLYHVTDRDGGCGSGCSGLNASDHWQSFVTGPDTGFIKFASAQVHGDDVTMKFTVHEGGPGGAQVGGPMLAHNPARAGDQMVGWEWPDGEEPRVQPNTRYWLHFGRADGQPIYTYASQDNPYPAGASSSSGGVDFYGNIYGMTREVNTRTGTLAGVVTDENGTGLCGVSVTSQPSGARATSACDGSYSMTVPVGVHELTAELDGFISATISGQRVEEGFSTFVDFTLVAKPPPGGGAMLGEAFEELPQWSSSFDASWGNAAEWTTSPGGQLGRALQAHRNAGGSSSKVRIYDIQPGTRYLVSLYMRAPSWSGSYWMESAYRLGEHSAQTFDENVGAWTMVKKLSTSSQNGNGNVWTLYTQAFDSGTHSKVSFGFKLGSSSSAPVVGWDTLRITPDVAGGTPPSIALSTSSLSQTVTVGGSPGAQSFQVSNSGGGTLSYRIEVDATWLSVAPATGTSTGEADPITVTYDATGLPPGDYAASIAVSEVDGTGTTGGASPRSIAVTLHVEDVPAPPVGIEENFERLPVWTSAHDASWGGAAHWSIAPGGTSGNALVVTRSSSGSSSRVQVLDVQPGRTYTLSVWARCPGGGSTYWAEAAFRLGSHGAQDFDQNANAWTMLHKFSASSPGANGNGNTWTRYSVTLHTGSATQLAVGFKLGASLTAPPVAWDTLRVQ